MSKERNYKYDPPKLMLYFIFINNSNFVCVSVPPKTTTESTGCKCGVERRSTDNNFNRIMGGKKIDDKMKYPCLVPLWKREVGEDGGRIYRVSLSISELNQNISLKDCGELPIIWTPPPALRKTRTTWTTPR